MLREMSPYELGEWMALWRLSPWGEDRGDLRVGILASLTANINRDSKKHPSPFRPEEFMPYVGVEDRKQDKALSARLRVAFSTTRKS